MHFDDFQKSHIRRAARNFLTGGKQVTVATVITFFRILLLPAILVFMIAEKWGMTFLLFAIAALTDAIDGKVARYFNEQTEWGAFLDTAADKFLIVSSSVVLACKIPFLFSSSYGVSAFVTATVSKELFLVAGSLYLYMTNRLFLIRPTVLGKVVAMMQMLFIAFIVILCGLNYYCPGYTSVGSAGRVTEAVCNNMLNLGGVSISFLVAALCVQYGCQAMQIVRVSRKKKI